MIDAIPLLLAPEGYQISRSVRLRSSASAYLNRTNATPTSATTWTQSLWVKRGSNIGTQQNIFGAGQSSGISYSQFVFESGNALNIGDAPSSGGGNWNLITTQVFRDPSAWYHMVIAYDSTQATASNRVKLYVNGLQVTAFSTAVYPTLNFASLYNTNAYIKAFGNIWYNGGPGGFYFDGYLTEINFIDGQALTPSSFGETNQVTGVWQPKKYTGTYGTNGFYLNFSDNSAATAAAIGKDYSGNGNNWTPNNISVTAGATYDSMLDVPTQWADGGNGRGNYATLNPLKSSSGNSVTNGNLAVTTTASGTGVILSSIGMSSGKWYWECVQTATTASSITFFGIAQDGSVTNTLAAASTGYAYVNSGLKVNAGTNTSYGASFTNSDVIGVAFDADAGTITFYKNGVSQGVAYSSIPAGTYFAGVSDNGTSETSSATFNFGQRPFAYTPPTGFRALNTLNLPTPTILKGNQFFDVSTWSGNASTQSIVNSGAMQPDLVWAKARAGTAGGTGHIWQDAVRGLPLYLQSNTNGAEASAADHITSFNSNGFSMGAGGSINAASTTYVGWQWKEGATQGFDIVTYTGTGVNRTVSHSLGVAPSMMIVKRRDAAGNNWNVYHAAIGNTTSLLLNDTAAQQAASAIYWNNTSPTSSVFTLGTGGNGNALNATYVAYLFSEVAGFSRFGSYTGNGSADGPFIFTGFRPRFVMYKRTDSIGNWQIFDSARSPNNVHNGDLIANSSAAEAPGAGQELDVLSNGFKPRTNNADRNASGGTYVFAAFSEVPFKNSLAR